MKTPRLHAAWRRAGRCCVALLLAARAGAQAAPPPTDAPQPQPLVLAVTLNALPRGDLFLLRDADGRLLLRVDDLATLGLRVEPRTSRVIDGVPHVRLDDIAGLSLALDERALVLALVAEPHLLSRSVIDSQRQGSRAARLPGAGGFLNWAVEQAQGQAPGLSLEAGQQLGPLRLLATGTRAVDTDGRRGFVRLQSSATWDRPQALQRWTFGDLVTTSPEPGAPVNLGGIAVSTHARLDPYRIRYPLGTVQGQAALPSEVDIYVDGQRVRTERVRPGEFEIRDLGTAQGARSVELVVRDAYGRVERFQQSLYASEQLLAEGLHEYQYAAGALRRRYGSASADYGAPAYALFHHWGASPDLTLGVRAQGRPGLLHAGPSATMRLGSSGLLSMAWAGSRSAGSSARARLLRYEFQATNWGLGLAWRADSPGFTALGEPPLRENRRREWQWSLNHTLGPAGSLWLAQSRLSTHAPAATPQPAPPADTVAGLGPRHSLSIGYAAFLPAWRGSLRVGIGRIGDAQGHRVEATASLVFTLGGSDFVAAGARLDTQGHSESLQWTRNPAGPGGWSHDLWLEQASAGGPATRWRGSSQLDADHARLRAEAGQALEADGTRRDSLRATAAGAIAWLDGQAYLGRPVKDSFAVVRVDGLAGVPVTVNGQDVGRTDARGRRFVAEVGANHELEFALDTRMVPIDRLVTPVRRRVRLAERSGARIDFEARRVRAVAARLQLATPQGLVPLAGAVVQLGGATRTDADGSLYLEDLPPGRHPGQATWTDAAGPARCAFTLDVPEGDDVVVEAGNLRCERTAEGKESGDPPR